MNDNEVENKMNMMVLNVKCVTVGFTLTVKITKSVLNIIREKT